MHGDAPPCVVTTPEARAITLLPTDRQDPKSSEETRCDICLARPQPTHYLLDVDRRRQQRHSVVAEVSKPLDGLPAPEGVNQHRAVEQESWHVNALPSTGSAVVGALAANPVCRVNIPVVPGVIDGTEGSVQGIVPGSVLEGTPERPFDE